MAFLSRTQARNSSEFGTSPKGPAPEALRCEISRRLLEDDVQKLEKPVLRSFVNFSLFDHKGFELFAVKWFAGERLVGAVPVIKMLKRRTTDMLKTPMRWWLGGIIGPFARRTTLLLDTALLGYDYATPFYCVGGIDVDDVKRRTVAELRRLAGVDSIWINEPESESAWASAEGFDSFRILPMLYVDTSNCESMEDYVWRLSKQRRRNMRKAQAAFEATGAAMTLHQAPLESGLAQSAFRCLESSALRSTFHVPYGDILNCREAFLQQRQKMLIASVGERVIGFMSFIHNGDQVQQTHGGFDYDLSLDAMAYHNLIYAAIHHAIAHKAQRVMLGPLNNETKRRAGSGLLPVVGSLWNRQSLDRFFAKRLLIPNFQIYRGRV